MYLYIKRIVSSSFSVTVTGWCPYVTSLGLQYCNAGTSSNGYMQLPYCASLVSFCKFGTARYDVIYCFFVLVAYPDSGLVPCVLHNPCKIRLGREALVLGCQYQSFCLSFQSLTSEPLVGFIIVNICFSCCFSGIVPCSPFSSHCLTSVS